MTRFRQSVRTLLRERLLDAAHALVTAEGWSGLRMTAAAAEAGVSRQTAYNEFGSKEALGEALVLREAERFLAGVLTELDAHSDDFEQAVTAAVAFTLRTSAENVLVGAITAGGPGGELLRYLTTTPESVLGSAVELLDRHIAETWPAIDPRSRALAVDAAVRLVISYLIQSTDAPEDTAGRIAVMVTRIAGDGAACG